jgi:hypothetical protein
MMERLLTVAIAAMLLLTPVSCSAETAKPEEEEAGSVSTTPPKKGIEIPFIPRAKTEKGYYIVGEPIAIEITLESTSPETVQIDSFPPIIEIRYRKQSPEDEPVRSFPAGTGSRSLAPGEVITYILTWDQRDDDGQQVDYGYYTLELRMGITRFGFGRILILPEEGVIERTIEVNESVTANGITVILKRVEMSSEETVFYATCNIPDASLHSRHHAEADFRLDDGALKTAGSAGFYFNENGVDLPWKQVDPVAIGTKELTLIINKIGDIEGLWEFHIPLE